MIRYPLPMRELAKRINARAPGWFDLARERTARHRKAGRFDESTTDAAWGQIKQVFMDVQHRKCAYCERLLADPSHGGRVEHDIEHFRPKSTVARWPDKPIPGLDFETGRPSVRGYYLLAYDARNYLVACKTCNTGRKGTRFPIEGPRRATRTTNRQALKAEHPLLVHPLDPVDDDPAKLITFEGVLPKPTRALGRRHRRALAVIELFGLAVREELLYERALAIRTLTMAFGHLDSTDPEMKALAGETLDRLRAAHAAHSQCAIAFSDLWKRDVATARQYAKQAQAYLTR